MPKFPELRLFSSIGASTPVWGPDGELGVDDLLGLGVTRDLVERLCAWADHVQEDVRAPVPRREEPGWAREERRLAYELQNQLPDVKVLVDAPEEDPPVQRALRRLGRPDGEDPPAVEADRPTALTVMAAPTVDLPLWSYPYGRCLAVDPSPLFVDEGLVAELRRWNRRFPGPARPEPRWCADGLVLARSLQDQLWDVEVRYHEDDDPAPVRGRRR